MIKLLKCPYVNHLNEIFQSNEVKFAFVNTTDTENTYQILMPFVKCREYFNELLMSNRHPEFSFRNVHGFAYDPAYKLNLEEVLLAVKFPNQNSADTFLATLDKLQVVEKQNNLDQLTTVEQTDIKNTYLIRGSKFWLQKCLLLNIYTMLIKLCALGYPNKTLKDIKTEWTNLHKGIPAEIQYVDYITENYFLNVINNLIPIAEFESPYVDGSTTLRDPYDVHGASGIVTVLKYSPTSYKHISSFMEFLQTIYKKKGTPECPVDVALAM